MEVPYTSNPHPETGATNGVIGMWLFIASEVMLFGALFTSLVLLRVGNADWPRGILEIPLASLNTAIMLASSATILVARKMLGRGNVSGYRLSMIATILLGTVFLVVKSVEYSHHIANGDLPATSTFFGMYYVLTGLHAVHVVGGILANLILLIFGRNMIVHDPKRMLGRVKIALLYWNFIDVVWIVVFLSLYLI